MATTQETSGGNMATTQETSGGNMATTPENSSKLLRRFIGNMATTQNSSNWLRDFIKPAIEVIKPVCVFFIDNSQHMFNPGKNVRRLGTETPTLISQKDGANREIETGCRNGKVETSEGRTWMERVDNAISDKERNHERYEQRRKVYGCYPNCWVNYKISKKAATTLGEVKWCFDNKPPMTVEPPPQPVELIPVDNTIRLKASQGGIIEDVLQYIKDDATGGLVGIRGPCQVGKTLLLKKINNSFYNGNSTAAFDFVIYITSSEEWSVQRIQSKIMQRLQIESNDLAASSTISKFLSEKSFLILLDDLRNSVDLAEVGIPTLGVHGQSNRKVVITTRSQSLCRKMKANEEIYVPGLKLEEALELFRDSAGEGDLCSDPNIKEHMEGLVDMLRVMPTELINFGRDMCGKGEPKQWEDVIHVVKELKMVTKDQEETSLRERIVIKLTENVNKLREESSGIRDKIELAKLISDGMAICESEQTEANWDISIAAAKLREIGECINGGPSRSDIAQPPTNCSRCLTKGHVMSECTMVVICDFCGLDEHVTKGCPLQDGEKPKAEPCGFAVDGLGVYHIPYSAKQKGESESRIACIKVIKGQMSAAQVTSELERLLPSPRNWKWKVEESGEDSFITTFPSKNDLERMVRWGPVKANCTKAKMVIEEKSMSEECKYEILPKVWVQFCGLSEELMETPVIWAVGSILGVTCSVDMNFTNKHGRARLNVAVLNPNLIPDLVKVVVGNYVYKLKFRVENKEDADSPKPIDMDTEPQEDGDDPKKEDQQEKENDINMGESYTYEPSTQNASGSRSVRTKNKAKNSPKPKIDFHAPPARTSKWSALVSDQDSLEQAIKQARVNLEDYEP